MNSVANISPIDGRYQKEVRELTPFFSESALMKYRILIEIEYLISLSQEKTITELPSFSRKQQEELRNLYVNFSSRDFQTIKKIEEQTRHDVKAVEYFLRRKFSRIGYKDYQEWIHFALTSEDVNNLSYSLMWQDAIRKIYIPSLNTLQKRIASFGQKYREMPLLALTHGQPATPTSLGKEFAVFANRINQQFKQLKSHKLKGKLSGASGTWSAHVISYPKVNWVNFTKQFVSSLGLEPNLLTTQIEPHDSLAESFHVLMRINTILLDFCRDMWLYISRGIFEQKGKAGEVGSSTMPHKINPIQFENAEGNLGIANAYLSHLSQKLPISRLQRDLSDSTVIRNQGMPLAHSLLACKNILKGLERMTVNKEKIDAELNDHWEVLAEAIQTILRKSGDKKAYERLKKLTRDQKITKDVLHSFIEGLELPDEEKQTLLSLTPQTYTGLSADFVKEL